jgi:UDP-N-acetylglucosamine 2-epimerase (non-hydrolysing)
MHLAFVFGTRPEIIKLSPLFRAAIKQGIPHTIIHTNQHYSTELDAVFFQELELPAPTINLNVGPGSQTAQTARMMIGLEAALQECGATCTIVQGDTNSVLAGALVSAKLHIPVAHVEAGLRSYDRAMPEEINRIVTDHISTHLFPPTEECAQLLRTEGINSENIHVVGNTVVDSVLQGIPLSESVDIASFGLEPGQYYLLTLHRPSNVDTEQDLREIVALLDTVSTKTGKPFFFPIHPRTEGNLKKFNISLPPCIIPHGPLGYRAFIALQRHAAAVFTDSGGIQEEACILDVPCLTLRDSTERPETITVGANRLVHRDVTAINDALSYFASTPRWQNPFGVGTTGQRIIELLRG